MVQEHVDHPAPHLARGRERPGVVTIRPDCPPPVRAAVDGPRAANGEPLHAAGETQGLVRLDDQVHVIELNGKINHAEAAVAGGGQRGAQLEKDAWGSQRWDAGPTTERDVNRMSGVVGNAPAVRHARARPHRLAAGAATTTAPAGRLRKRELTWTTGHLTEQ